MFVSDAVFCFKNVYVVYLSREELVLHLNIFFWELWLSTPGMNIFHSL